MTTAVTNVLEQPIDGNLHLREAARAGEHHYLTLVYSPCVSKSCDPGAVHFFTFLPKMPVFIPIALITFVILAGVPGDLLLLPQGGVPVVLPGARGLRGTGAAQEVHGESRFPLVLLNLHRYFFYGAVLFGAINVYDGVLAFHGKDGSGSASAR